MAHKEMLFIFISKHPSPLKVSYPNFQLRSQKNVRLEETPPGMIFFPTFVFASNYFQHF